MANLPAGKRLSELEQQVMEYVWAHQPVSAARCRDALAKRRPLRENTVRTIFHRLERKGFVRHTVEGRTFMYSAAEPRPRVVMRAVQHVVDRFCGGSAEQLVVGLVESGGLTPAQLERIGRKIAARKRGES